MSLSKIVAPPRPLLPILHSCQFAPTTSTALVPALFFFIYIQDAWEDYSLLSAIHSHMRMALPTDVVFYIMKRMVTFAHFCLIATATSWLYGVLAIRGHPLRDMAAGTILIRFKVAFASAEAIPLDAG